MHRPQRSRIGAAILGLLVMVPALGACGGEDDLDAGTVVQAREDSQFTETGTAVSLTLPLGQLEISTGKPTKQIEAKENRDLEAVEAPSGHTFIPITWQYDAGTFGDYADYLQTTDDPMIDLVADGARYRIAAPESTGEGAESFYVLVGGNGKDAQLDVDFDGVTQSVDLVTGERETGRAAPLYALKPRNATARSCTDGATFTTKALARLSGPTCKVTPVVELPYAGGKWAPEGKTWLGVSVTTSVARYDEYAKDLKSGATYSPSEVTSTFTAGGAEPTTVIEDAKASMCPDQTTGACTKVYHVIFEIDPGKTPKQLQVKQAYTLTLFSKWGNGTAKDSVKVTGTISMPLR